MHVSPSIVYRCIDILESLSHHGVRRLCDVEQLEISGAKLTDVISALDKIGWIDLSIDRNLALTERSRRVYGECSSKGLILREFLLDYVDAANPPWLQIVPRGRNATLTKIDDGVRQLFVDADLDEGTDPGCVRFWDALAARARGLKDARLTNIGRDGERLSIDYENRRTGVSPKWVAVDDSTLGYDVLSVVSGACFTRLRIEVKTSTSNLSSAMFYVTRNEWELACSAGEHCFHLWDISKGDASRLAVLKVNQLAPHIPAFAGRGKWTSIEVPFIAFESQFREIG